MTVIPFYPCLARAAVTAGLTGGPEPSPALLCPDETLWKPRRACFVSLKTMDGELRGCLGTIRPTQADLGREIMVNALSAATLDPRFPPLIPAELPAVIFSVDILSAPEPVTNPDELDPARWGVIVSQGGRRGLLLPDLPGVDTVERQIAIAARKAGLHDLKNLTLERFGVERHPETNRP